MAVHQPFAIAVWETPTSSSCHVTAVLTAALCAVQAVVEGQEVTWLVPHSTGQVLPVDVDYRVMLTFLEFHQTLLQFVFFKLYHTLGLRYPPKVPPPPPH